MTTTTTNTTTTTSERRFRGSKSNEPHGRTLDWSLFSDSCRVAVVSGTGYAAGERLNYVEKKECTLWNIGEMTAREMDWCCVAVVEQTDG